MRTNKGQFVKGNPSPKYWLGKKHSEETKKKMSIAHKGNTRGYKKGISGSPKTQFKKGQIAWNKGLKHSKETKRKQSEARLKNPTRYWLGKKIPKEVTKRQVETRIKNPSKVFKDTSIELRVETELKRRNIGYQKQVPLCKVAIVDFYLPKHKIVIQCDGDYWHNLQDHKERDERQDKVLTSNGLTVYRFWEHKINQSARECINTINF